MHEVLLHGVLFENDKFWVPFQTTVGSARVAPTAVEQTTATDSGSFDVTFTTGVDLPGLSAEAFGLSQPQHLSETVHQDNPNDFTTASTKVDFTVSHASRATIDLPDVGSNDVDLFVLYDANHDGTFAPSEVIAASTGGAGDAEHVELVRPADGNYQIWLHGFQVAGTPTIPLDINVIQGNDLTVTGVPAGPIAGGSTVTLHVTYAKTMTSGQTYEGELLLGPSTAPTVISVPVTIHRS
jgi:hypothetical protein